MHDYSNGRQKKIRNGEEKSTNTQQVSNVTHAERQWGIRRNITIIVYLYKFTSHLK